MVMDVSEEGASMPSKPIVSDMTVSSKESEGKVDDNRDETTLREDSRGDRDDEKKTLKQLSRNKPAPPKSLTKGRYQYPASGPPLTMSQRGTGGSSNGPFMSRASAPPYAPPPYYHGSSYGGPGGPHGGPHHPHQASYPHHPHHGHGHPHGPPQHQHPHHSHMMGHYGNSGGMPYMQNGPPPPPPPRSGSYPPPPPPHYSSGPYGMPYGMPPTYQQQHSMNLAATTSDSASTGSKGSKGSLKKRTIEGVSGSAGGNPIPNAYSFRRSDSNSSSTSTVTAGNNTSGDTNLTDESPSKRGEQSDTVPPLNMGSLSFDDHEAQRNPSKAKRYHRRDYSGASTASSLSVGGFSLESYEGPRVGATEDHIMSDDPLLTNSPKRHKTAQSLIIDAHVRPPSITSHTFAGDKSARFEQLSIEAGAKMPTSTSSSSSAGQDRNLFLSLSTSPINHDVDATPVSKNTTKPIKSETDEGQKKTASIFKPKGGVHPKIETSASGVDRPSDTPTPPVHGEVGSSMTDDHSMLNRHLRNQSFTPLPHLSTNESTNNSPSGAAFASSIAPQLSWSIAGDTPSLGDLAEWEEDNKSGKNDQKIRPSSTSSSDTRNMMISPHEFQFWKEEQELTDTGVSGTTTPLPFFEQSSDGAENNMRYDHKKAGEAEHLHHMYMSNSGVHGPGGLKPSNKPMLHPIWSKHHEPHEKHHMGMPPTPMYASSDYRDDGFGPRSPMGADRRDGGMEYYAYPPHPAHAHNDRIRHLRGRVPHGHHMPPMPLHIPPPMSAHLPMTSPMGLGPKAGLWSPHHHAGMPPPLASPHHMGSPLGNMAQSKRKCVPLKPPIPSKFQGDMDKSKGAPVPEFTSLVNFPAHMSQKQSVNLPEGMRCCVMCGQACPCSTGNKSKKCKKSDGSLAPRSSNGQDQLADKNAGYAIIPTQNKGLCTLCDVNVWVVVSSGLEIKWCKGCKNFRPWAAFGDKGLATKCLRCRERQREKYALQKEEKEKARLTTKVKK